MVKVEIENSKSIIRLKEDGSIIHESKLPIKDAKLMCHDINLMVSILGKIENSKLEVVEYGDFSTLSLEVWNDNEESVTGVCMYFENYYLGLSDKLSFPIDELKFILKKGSYLLSYKGKVEEVKVNADKVSDIAADLNALLGIWKKHNLDFMTTNVRLFKGEIFIEVINELNGNTVFEASYPLYVDPEIKTPVKIIVASVSKHESLLIHDSTVVATIPLNIEEAQLVKKSVVDFIDRSNGVKPYITESNDSKLGLVVDVFDEQEEVVDTCCFFYDDFREN